MSGEQGGCFYQPTGVRKATKKKYAIKTTRVQALHNGMTHRPSVLKEGYLLKPSFFRFGGRRRRWCVLRTYNSTEASLDIFLDDTKTRYKGNICLDREAEPLLFVRSTDHSTAHKGESAYIALKVGKNAYHFTTDSFKELKEWCALFRQVIDSAGTLFSAKVVEPSDLDDGVVNVQFTSNYIALICPVKEISIKRWRLEHITSFGQCGGMLTYECCPRCSATSRCSLNIRHEKPATILSMMEKTIRENPNTNEIHYERSILGDIYHCSHSCSPRMFSAHSDTNLFRLNSSSSRRPHGEASVPPPDLHLHRNEFSLGMFQTNTLDSTSNDSGIPGTPQPDESPRSSSIFSPYSSGKPSPTKTSPKEKLPSPPAFRSRCSSDSKTRPINVYRDSVTPGRDTDDSEDSDTRGITYTKILHKNGNEASITSSLPSSPIMNVTYSSIKRDANKKFVPQNYNRLSPVAQSKTPPTPPERRESRFRDNSNSPPNVLPRNMSPSKVRHNFQVPVGAVPPPPKKLFQKPITKTEVESSSRFEMIRDSSQDRDHPISDLTLPETRGRSGTEIQHKELPSHLPRERVLSHSDNLRNTSNIPHNTNPRKFRQISKSTSDEIDEDMDEYEYDTLEELKSIKPFFRLDELEYDETDNEVGMEVMSNLLDYRRQPRRDPYCQPAVIDKVLSKVACDNVRGYAYKISIPVAGDVIYDVPRRFAPMPDTKRVNPNAPPKPLRKGSEFLTPVVSTEA